MIFNTLMNELLPLVEYPSSRPDESLPIWKRLDLRGEPFWGVDACWTKSAIVACDKENADLTEMEWHCNEVYLNVKTDLADLLCRSLAIIAAWKRQMESYWPETPFDILLSVDDGEDCDTDLEDPASATLRFWAVRGGEHFITPNAALSSLQPVLMEQVNCSSQ